MKVSGGLKEQDITVGNTYDKYGSRNPIVRWMMEGFTRDLSELVAAAAPRTIHEVGCGEGYWVMKWHRQGFDVRGSDFSTTVIEIARREAAAVGVAPELFSAKSIYDLDPAQDSADLIVCCEVMEHLEHPETALEVLQRLGPRNVILSVPREPLWRILNMARGKYLSSFGNTDGHIQHWTPSAFKALISRYFDIIEVRAPLPWTMLLCRPRGSSGAR
ncbi:MAG: Methyltransferase type 11 [Xanthobacteraceae bacterium]|nr:Methyltransferase type 11 [Xanthobacteraceae bacterium]